MAGNLRIQFLGGTFAALLLLLGSGSHAAGPSTRLIIAFGDSTTAERQVEGEALFTYSRILSEDERLREGGWEIMNAGLPGDTTRDARARFQRDVLRHQPAIVILQFGINDSMVDVWKNPPVTKPRVSLEDYAAHLTWLIGELDERGVAPILMTPNPLAWTDRLRELYGQAPYRPDDPGGLNVLLEGYAQTVRQVARTAGVALIDVYSHFTDSNGLTPRDGLLLDGMHPNEAGHLVIAALLRAVLDREDVKGGLSSPRERDRD
jgi:lysophospholipase L1-like esterase